MHPAHLKTGGVEASLIYPSRSSGGSLWMGSKPRLGTHVHDEGFDVLILCAAEIQSPSVLFPGVIVIHSGIDDDDRYIPSSHRQLVASVGRIAARHVREGRNVLVTCQQGRNRSGLVAAIALHYLTGKSGSRCARRVQALRESPFGPALTNGYFLALLDDIPDARGFSAQLRA